MTQPDTPENFATVFGSTIRVCFNWNRFFSERWPVAPIRVTTIDELGACVLPWYLGSSRGEVLYTQPDAIPLELSRLPQALNSLNQKRQAGIQNYVAKFKEMATTVEFPVPAYTLSDNRHLVLDGNHRLSALMLCSVPFIVTLWSIRGPLEANCLPDLVHWRK
jgi:hypothetical protein